MLRDSRLLTIAFGVTFLLGCGGGSGDGPERYDLSGEVTFKGEPVPTGYIQFYPDSEKGNSGPGTGAEIKKGRYSTPTGKGVVGGPHVVEITGQDGVPITVEGEGEISEGTELFPRYKTTVDLPKESGKQDFEVPNE